MMYGLSSPLGALSFRADCHDSESVEACVLISFRDNSDRTMITKKHQRGFNASWEFHYVSLLQKLCSFSPAACITKNQTAGNHTASEARQGFGDHVAAQATQASD
ncbi:hypothetical protein AKJ16_DCAP05148 [Drosera capensis]